MAPEAKFGKSASNRLTENVGLALLCHDPRIQVLDNATKKRIIEILPVSGDWGIQTFDAVMTSEPTEPLTVANIEDHIDTLRLVEMKTTKKPIRDAALNNFFFGATEREYAMARALGDRYLFAFVVLVDDVAGRQPFCVLLTLDEVEERTRTKRIQYQVNFRSDVVLDQDFDPRWQPGRAAEDAPPYA